MEEIEQAPKKSKEALMKELKDEKHAELKNQLAACETIAEVEAITWPEACK